MEGSFLPGLQRKTGSPASIVDHSKGITIDASVMGAWNALSSLWNDLDQIYDCHALVHGTLSDQMVSAQKALDDAYRAVANQHELGGGTVYEPSYEEAENLTKLTTDGMKTTSAITFINESLFIRSFACVDHFHKLLLSYLSSGFRDRFVQLDSDIKIRAVLGFSDMPSLVDDLIERRIESLTRDSYEAFYRDVTTILGLTFDSKTPFLSSFFEASQVRNLIVHNGGIVNKRAFDICRKLSTTSISENMVGDKYPVTVQYVHRTLDAIEVTCTRFVTFLINKAFNGLDEQIFPIILHRVRQLCIREKWSVALDILDGLEHSQKKLDIYSQALFLIHKAFVIRSLGDKKESQTLLVRADWSHNNPELLMLKCAVNENIEIATEYYEKVDKNALHIQYMLQQWPMLARLREHLQIQVNNQTQMELYMQSVKQNKPYELPEHFPGS